MRRSGFEGGCGTECKARENAKVVKEQPRRTRRKAGGLPLWAGMPNEDGCERSIALRTVAQMDGCMESEEATYLGEGLQHAGRWMRCGKSFPDRIDRYPRSFAAPFFLVL